MPSPKVKKKKKLKNGRSPNTETLLIAFIVYLNYSVGRKSREGKFSVITEELKKTLSLQKPQALPLR